MVVLKLFYKIKIVFFIFSDENPLLECNTSVRLFDFVKCSLIFQNNPETNIIINYGDQISSTSNYLSELVIDLFNV